MISQNHKAKRTYDAPCHNIFSTTSTSDGKVDRIGSQSILIFGSFVAVQ
jgi:hypothetical protein